MSHHHFSIEDAKRYGVDTAIVLNNLRYWLSHNKANNKNVHDGYVWTYNSARAFSELFPYWSGNKIQKLLKKLERDGVIITGNYNKVGYDKTKWYTLPEFNIQPNGLKVSADSLKQSSEMAEPIPDINTDITQENITDIFASQKTKRFIDQLSREDYPNCTEAMKVIKAMKKDGWNVYDGNLTEQEWDECEFTMSTAEDFDTSGYIDWWIAKYSSGFTKPASLPDMLCDVNGSDFQQFYDSTYLQQCGE